MTCVMCANPVGKSQVMGIGRENLFTNTGPMTAHPVCGRCFIDPKHRLIKHKLHFTSLAESRNAVEMARKLDEMSKAGEDLSL